MFQIDNPAYKGVWVHPEVDNPEYSPDDKLYLRKEIGTLGLDLWQVKAGTIFDNFLITDDVEAAKAVGDKIKATQVIYTLNILSLFSTVSTDIYLLHILTY